VAGFLISCDLDSERDEEKKTLDAAEGSMIFGFITFGSF
jgi:hypothetical protein